MQEQLLQALREGQVFRILLALAYQRQEAFGTPATEATKDQVDADDGHGSKGPSGSGASDGYGELLKREPPSHHEGSDSMLSEATTVVSMSTLQGFLAERLGVGEGPDTDDELEEGEETMLAAMAKELLQQHLRPR